MFSLKRPCVDCPWRTDLTPYLSAQRVIEIVQAPAFQCHKTVDYTGEDPSPGSRPQQCAGLMIVLHRDGRPNQIMQVAERLGGFSADTLDQEAPVYHSIVAAVVAHGGDPKGLAVWLQDEPLMRSMRVPKVKYVAAQREL